MSYSYDYPMPAVTVDVAVAHKGKLLLIQRKNDPFRDCWCFPGGFMDIDERLEDAAIRELYEETGLKLPRMIDNYRNEYGLEFVSMFDSIDRDPRHRTLTALYFCKIPRKYDIVFKAGDDAKNCKWFPIEDLFDNAIEGVSLGFDHHAMIKVLYYRYFCH